MSRRYTATIPINEENGATVSFSVTWGAPETGPSYACGGTPADPDEITDLRVELVDTCEVGGAEARMYADDILASDDLCDRLLIAAAEQDADERERAAEMRAEDRAEREAEDWAAGRGEEF